MGKIKLILGVFLLQLFLSCKRDYTCVCTNPSGYAHDFYNVPNQTKKIAKQKCEEYYNNNYASVAMNEISCEIKTK